MDPNLIHVIRAGEASGGAIAEIESCDFFGKPCVKGKLQQLSPTHWAAGTIAYIPIEQITGITVFENKAAWVAGISRYQAKSRPNCRMRVVRIVAYLVFGVAAFVLGRLSTR